MGDAPAEQFEVHVLGTDVLVGGGDLVAALDAPQVPTLTADLCLEVPGCEPRSREPGVVDPSGPLLAPQVVDHRHRSDRRQVRGTRRRHEQLADARVAEPDHTGTTVQDPGLTSDRLHHVVPVRRLSRTQHVEHSSGATTPAHVDPDDGEAHQVGQQRRRLGLVRVGGRIAGVLDHGRPRCRAVQVLVREADHGRQLHPVAHGQVAVSLGELLVVE